MMAIEAMACSTPVIASDNTALTETLNYGNAGVLIDDGNIQQFVKEVERMKYDKIHRNDISAKGLAYIKDKYDINKYYKKMLNLYFMHTDL